MISSGPILGALAEITAEATSTSPASSTRRRSTGLPQWASNLVSVEGASAADRARGHAVHRQALDAVGAGIVHDYMHAKVTVCDDTVFLGSFNLSHSGETNAENVLEIEDAAIADRWPRSSTRCARYPPVELRAPRVCKPTRGPSVGTTMSIRIAPRRGLALVALLAAGCERLPAAAAAKSTPLRHDDDVRRERLLGSRSATRAAASPQRP